MNHISLSRISSGNRYIIYFILEKDAQCAMRNHFLCPRNQLADYRRAPASRLTSILLDLSPMLMSSRAFNKRAISSRTPFIPDTCHISDACSIDGRQSTFDSPSRIFESPVSRTAPSAPANFAIILALPAHPELAKHLVSSVHK